MELERTDAVRLTRQANSAALAERLGSHSLSEIESGTILVLPSLSFPVEELRKIVGIQFYEERMLFVLLLLDRPELDVVYVTSTKIEDSIVDYYLSFLDDPESGRNRLHLVTLNDPRPEALARKLLGRPDVLDELREVTSGPTFVFPFNVTNDEWHVAEELNVLVYGPSPALALLGSKTGARIVAREAGVPLLPGSESLRSAQDIETSLDSLKRAGASSAVVKLNNGFSGQGNAILDLTAPFVPLDSSASVFCASEESWPSFIRKIGEEGGVAEQLVTGPGIYSPSVQVRIAADQSFEIVSTHDQILGGPDEQVYLGCHFPAAPAYRREIQEFARRIAKVLADKGVIGSFGIDFIVATEGAWQGTYMAEINLRMGGTSHPFYMARFATRGHYDEDSGHLLVDDEPRFYVASDNFKDEAFIGVKPARLIDEIAARGLAFDRASATGATLHLLGALPTHGKFGCVAIAKSSEEAEVLYDEVRRVAEEIASR
jgi:hypothetical protein